MSWFNNFTDLAGKAESLLNNIDQSAAAVISKASVTTTEDSVEKDSEKSLEGRSKQELSEQRLLSKESTNTSESPGLSRAKAKTLHREAERLAHHKASDDALFDFLNSSQKVMKSRSVPVTPRPMKLQKDESTKFTKATVAGVNTPLQSKEVNTLPPTLEISRSSSFDSINSKRNHRKTSENGSVASDQHGSYPDTDIVTLPTDSTASESEYEMVASLASKSDRDSPSTNSQASGSDLTIENRLLRSELTSLHQELTQSTERNKKITEGLHHRNNQLQTCCDDLREELKVKNTQVSALNMRLTEVEKLLELEHSATAQLRAEKDRILLDQSEGSGMHARAIDELRSRLNETENALTQERNSLRNCQQEILDLRSRHDLESKKVVESLQKTEVEKQKEKKKVDELSSELKSLRSNLDSAKQELSDYKQKAARILQSKERLIASLKGSSESEMTTSTINSFELEEIRQERDTARDDLHSARIELANMKAEFQDVEQQSQQDQSILQQEVNELRRDLKEEATGRQEAESEVHRLQEEARREKEENSRSRTVTQSRLRDKDSEIERLRNQLMLRSQSTPQESELEARLRQLTEAVIQKQSLVETLSAEKSSLTLQLERMEGQVKRLSQEGSKHVKVNMSDDDGFRHSNIQSSILFPPSASNHGVVGKVRKAASALDQFSIRLGVFLKRYPSARLFVLTYMGLLHIWVMIVLFTYTPEAHNEDFFKALKPDSGH